MSAESDRELLELAAKAAGLPMGYADGQYFYCEHGPFGPGMCGKQHGAPLYWNPLTDDGDALRLAVKCRITDLALIVGQYLVSASYRAGDDMCAITRRAITNAAAEIARATHKEGA